MVWQMRWFGELARGVTLHATLRVSRLLALYSLMACGGPSENAAAPSPNAPPVQVVLGSALETEVARVIPVTGTLSAEESVVVTAKVPGRVIALAVDLGSRVKKGDIIAQLDPVDYALRVQQAEALLLAARATLGIAPGSADERVDEERVPDVAAARATRDGSARQLARFQQLVDKKLVGAADLDAVSAAAARAEAQLGVARQGVWARSAALKQRKSELAMAQQALADTSLRAPISGAVRERSSSVGALLAVGAPVAALVCVDPMRLRVIAPEQAAHDIAAGQRVRLKDDHGAVIAEGRVARVAPILSADTRGLAVEADIPATPGLVPGSFVRADIETGARDTIVSVPESAVVVFAGLHKVLTVVDGKVREVAVEVGETRAGRTAIESGLPAGTPVILAPRSLQNGDAVAVFAEGTRAEAR